MISTEPTYDSYCNQLENERVERILNERHEMEEKIVNYECLINSIEDVLEEKTTIIEKIKWIKKCIKSFREDNG